MSYKELEEFPEHILAIAGKIHPEDSMGFLMPVGGMLNHLEGREDDFESCVDELRNFLEPSDAAVLLEWLGIEVNETDGLKISIKPGTNIHAVVARYRQFEHAL